MPYRRLPLLLLVTALCLVGCGPQTGPAISLLAAPRSPIGSVSPGARDLGRLPGRVGVNFLLLLRDPGAAARERAIAAMYNPHSRHFGTFQSPAAWDSSGPSATVVRHVERFLHARGLTTRWQSGGDWLTVSGPARVVSRVFRVRIDRFRGPNGQRLYAALNQPRVPAALRAAVTAVGRISNFSDRRAHAVPANGMTPVDLLKAYDIQPLRSQGLTGAGETVSFIEIDGFHQSDFNQFTGHFGLPAMHPQIKAGSALTNVDGEAEMDMEVMHEIAPRARLQVYDCSSNCANTDIINLENQVVRQNPHGIVSISLGGCERAEAPADANAERSAFDQADALGESVFVASGDSGAYECLTENWGAPPTDQYVGVSSPASMPGVTGVGGTRLAVNGNGHWAGEQVWEEPAASGGTGGGVSVYFHQPAWQTGPGVNGGANAHMRQVPDVAAAADPLTATTVYVNGRFVQQGGTSQAAPIWAGITALVDQYLAKNNLRRAGFLNPALYAIAAGRPPYPAFHDVTVGSNLKYPAGPGYDMATGLGTPDAWNLARDLARYIRQGHP